jgi:hypothetical protein
MTLWRAALTRRRLLSYRGDRAPPSKKTSLHAGFTLQTLRSEYLLKEHLHPIPGALGRRGIITDF